MCLALCACGGGTSENTMAFPKTTEDEHFSMTLKDAKVTYAVEHSDSGDSFFIPTESDSSSSTTKILVPGDSNAMLYFEAEYKYIGKETYNTTDFVFLDAFEPKLSIDDYSFTSNYFVFHRTNNEDWRICAADSDISVREALGLSLPNVSSTGNYGSFEYQPLDDNVYTLRGVIVFPKKIAEECAKECTLKLGGLSFTFAPN